MNREIQSATIVSLLVRPSALSRAQALPLTAGYTFQTSYSP